VLRLLETLSRDGKGHLTLLEVEICWSKDGDYSFEGVQRRVKGAVDCRNIHVKKAFGHTVDDKNGFRNFRRDFHHYLSPCEHVSLGQVDPQEENNLKRTGLSHWQLDDSLHRIYLHFPNVSCCLIDDYASCLCLCQPSVESVRIDSKCVSIGEQWRHEGQIEGKLCSFRYDAEVSECQSGR
jgi:hypothetical protein